MDVKAIFGANLKQYRKEKSLSQEELAARIDITPNHLSKIERGIAFVSAPLLDRIVCVLDISFVDLFYTLEEKPRHEGMPTVEHVLEEVEKALAKIRAKM